MIVRALLVGLTAALLLASPAAAAPERSVAVTFDDLPYQAQADDLCNPELVIAISHTFVEMLKPLDTHATGFVNSERACEGHLVEASLEPWIEAGFEIGNHTANHPNIHRMTVDAWLADVDIGDRDVRPLLEQAGRKLTYFRHPYLFTGETPEKKAAMAAGLAARGYTVAPVTIDNNDWMFAAVYRQAEAAGDKALMQKIGEAYVAHMIAVLDHYEPYSAELTGGREPAQVLLLHANHLNRDWYPRIHELFLARGYRFVPLETALKDPIYALPDTYVKANGVSWLHRWTFTAGRPIRWEPDPPAWIVTAYETAK